MSQMVTRQRTGGDEKEKRTESPVKDMKKKMAANAEKEKNTEQATTKSDKPTEKPADKPTDKPANKSAEKPADKPADKAADKPQKADKASEKPAEKKPEKAAEKKDGQSEKKKEENGKGESSAKTDKPGKPDARPKQNGSNGVNGTVSPDSESDELVIDEADETELFPELAYDDSDVEWEPGMDCPSRSLTRRSQVKVTRTPETPRPASDKDAAEESKDSKVLKLNQDTAKTSPETPKDAKKDAKKETPKEARDAKKAEAQKEARDAKAEAQKEVRDSKKAEAQKEAKKDAKEGKQDTGEEAATADAKKEVKESPRKEDKEEKVEFEVVVDIENNSDPAEESRKPDTNFSKSRVKVSPYRRSMRLADQTTSSVAANYTGNNTTMEMDITESSSFMEESMDDSSYLSGLRSIKGRRSYKPLQEMAVRGAGNRSVRPVTSTIVLEHSSRPTAPVVGRKRKPEPEEADVSLASEADERPAAGKRQRLLERLARPFRRTQLLPRRDAEIVGINTDLPLSAPVASSSRDPETIAALKQAPPPAPAPPPALAPPPTGEDPKRCVLM